VHPTRDLGTSGHDGKTMAHYVRMAFALGLGGALRLGHRYGRAALAMIRAWREHLTDHGRNIRSEHERQMHELGERLRLSVDKLRALSALSATPVTRGFFAILRSLFLDLAAAITGSVVLITLLLAFGLLPAAYVLPIAGVLGAGIYVWMKSSKVIDQCAALRHGARRVAELLPARFVVMGHTHAPTMESIARGVTYVNLGGWATDDLGSEPQHEVHAPCTHLVIHHRDGVPHAELRRWSSETGPSVMHDSRNPVAQSDSGVHPRPDNDVDDRAA
jgi:hypothetical protein